MKSHWSVRKLCSGCHGLPSTLRLPIGERAQAYRTDTKVLPITVAALVWFQVGVYRRSNRIVNIGLAAATIALAAAILVIGNGLATRTAALDNAEQGGYDSIVTTSRLQAAAYELQSQLSLQLLGAGSGDRDELTVQLDADMVTISSDADSTRERAAARELEVRWTRYRDVTAAIAEQPDQGQAIASFQGGGLSTFNGLNTSIESVLSDNRTQFTDGVDTAADSVGLVPWLTIVLPAIAVVAIVLGVQRRLADYQ